MHCTLYTYQAKQRIFQNKNISLLSYFSQFYKNALMPTHNFGILHVFCFEGCCRFYNNYCPLTPKLLTQQTYDDLVRCPWPDQESLTQTIDAL